MRCEGVILTGGASRRMGEDKAAMMVHGVPMAHHVARELLSVCERVTVLGREPIEGCAFVPDREEYAGPLVSLRGFRASSDLVFVASCDLPLFRAIVVTTFAEQIGSNDAVIPEIGGYRQPLVALYRAAAFEHMPNEGARVRDWTDRLEVRVLSEDQLTKLGLQSTWLRGVNTPDELRDLLAHDSD